VLALNAVSVVVLSVLVAGTVIIILGLVIEEWRDPFSPYRCPVHRMDFTTRQDLRDHFFEKGFLQDHLEYERGFDHDHERGE
jgi:hypothetical protein